MTDVIQDPIAEMHAHVENGVAEQSLRERVKARAQQLKLGNTRLPVDVPGYNGDVVAFFRKVPFAELKTIGQTIDREKQRSDEAELNACCDALLRTVVDVKLRDPNDPSGYSPISEDGAPMLLGSDLATALGLGPYPDERAALKAVLGLGGDAGILGMFDSVMNWSRGKSVDEREQLVGESSAIRT
jgi:hypothetical protein